MSGNPCVSSRSEVEYNPIRKIKFNRCCLPVPAMGDLGFMFTRSKMPGRVAKESFEMGDQCRKQRECCPIDLAIFLSLNWLEKRRLLLRDRNQMISGRGAGCSDPRLLTRSCFRIRRRRIAAVSVSFAGSGDSQAA